MAGRRRSFGRAGAVDGGDGAGPGRREKWSGLAGEVVTGDGVWIRERNQREIVVGERDRGGGEDKGERVLHVGCWAREAWARGVLGHEGMCG